MFVRSPCLFFGIGLMIPNLKLSGTNECRSMAVNRRLKWTVRLGGVKQQKCAKKLVNQDTKSSSYLMQALDWNW